MPRETPVRIGLPRGLLYHTYGIMWNHFFRSLGCQVITSPETNRQILEAGIRWSIDENCLAVKIFLGHVAYLQDKADYIFIPRIKSSYHHEATCVKLIALGDIVRNTFENIRVLEYSVDVTNRLYELPGILKVGVQVHWNPLRVLLAYRQAFASLLRRKQELSQKQAALLKQDDPSAVRILIVGHTYIAYDMLLGKTIASLLEKQGAQVLYADRAPHETARELSANLSSDLYWSYNKELLGGIEIYRRAIDGIVFVMAFPCGPDSLVACLCQHRITDIPMCVLTMDELQGDAGLKTRLESFVDILRLKKEMDQ